MVNPADLRREYSLAGLRRADLSDDPFTQFTTWFEIATAQAIGEPNAMTLATADATGFPSGRTVLLKGYGPGGFCFYSNYGSRKGRELAENPRASLVFLWQNLERQVIISGNVERVSIEQSLAYFHTRPRKSQLGALVSEQSSVVPDRAFLEKRMTDLETKYSDTEIPLPENWGGYRVIPVRFEFWQGQRSRLHDRFEYTQTERKWQIDRLSP